MLGRVLLGLLMVGILTKPVYDHSKSNIQPLTNLNFNDQVSKIRQSTNYVSIVHFYKYNGNIILIQTRNHSNLALSSTSGPTSIRASSKLEQSTVSNMPNFAERKTSQNSQRSSCMPQFPFHQPNTL